MNDFRRLRFKLGLSKPKLCKLFDPPIPLRTWEHYEAGERKAPEWVKGMIVDILRYNLRQKKISSIFHELDGKELTLEQIDNVMIKRGYKSVFDEISYPDLDNNGCGFFYYYDEELTEESDVNEGIGIYFNFIIENLKGIPEYWCYEPDFTKKAKFQVTGVDII